MKIVQMSDLHITENIDIRYYKNKIDKLYHVLCEEIKQDEEIIFCICGDIIDGGKEASYDNAEIIFDYLTSKFQDYRCNYEFTPGNHDLCNNDFRGFDKFIRKYLKGDKYEYQKQDVIIRKYDDVDLILVNSIFHKDFTYGAINMENLKEALRECNKGIIIVTHHTLMSRYQDDKSSIRNSYEFINSIQGKGVCGLLHGHTHGYSNITIGDMCKVVGVGPLFKEIKDINNQFNIIDILAEKIDEITNFRYSADFNKYNKIQVYKRKNMNIFQGTKTSEQYLSALETTKQYGCINNFNMKITTSCEDFFSDMQKTFLPDIEIAKQWQALELPETLYYNHGQYMQKDGIDGIKHIIKELQSKATSSRAIIPLIDIKNVIGSGDNFLPSLDIIQFGFNTEDRTELYVTLYLRALEVQHFLRINLSEIYVMVKRLKEEIRSINKLNINVFAFKAQCKEQFGCFKKAKIDILEERNIMRMVDKKQISEIYSMLKEKLELSATVVNVKGIINLYNCIIEFEKDESFFSPSLLDNIQNLINSMKLLEQLRTKTSNYIEIKEHEKKVEHNMVFVIKQFETLKGGS
ncbi:metallophosphoesterase [Clostridium estertheticum]|uniref:metallophosphoesterase family protein n=1 Tax=Clostridium estertheticum TaxID=238834 RepID=UPI001C0CF2AA|nr:metallophosphoesterase [Clostridium estertheticum]MBU3201560.1 metallophosphoesterase [Clostridium estertheticum]WAG66260.1 metallophosphoesterase [Clostridium estertheticum]